MLLMTMIIMKSKRKNLTKVIVVSSHLLTHLNMEIKNERNEASLNKSNEK